MKTRQARDQAKIIEIDGACSEVNEFLELLELQVMKGLFVKNRTVPWSNSEQCVLHKKMLLHILHLSVNAKLLTLRITLTSGFAFSLLFLKSL